MMHKDKKTKRLGGQWIQVGLLLLLSGVLAGCGSISENYTEFIDEKAYSEEVVLEDNQAESVEESQAIGLVDIRLVPELSMVEHAMMDNELYKVNELLFNSAKTFFQKQASFELAIEQVTVYSVEDWDESLDSQFNHDPGEGGIVLLDVTLTNTSNDTFYFPIEELKLSYPDAPFQNYPSHDLYPLESGNLAQILLENQGELAAQSAVEGYLVYGVGEEALEEITDLGSFYLTVVPPRQTLDQIIGLDSTVLGEELPLFLPVDKKAEAQLSLNSGYIQDRLTTEWWGEKTILASELLNDRQEEADIAVTLNRIELAEFETKAAYEEVFQNFVHGQVIVSLEYEIENNSEVAVLPIDGAASLVINGDEINSDYLLINERYGKVLEPGQSSTVIKTFALDKMRYQELWQGEEIYISINVPVDQVDNELEEAVAELEEEEDVDDMMTEDEKQAELLEEGSTPVTNFYFEFNWLPTLNLFVDDAMELVEELPEEETEDEEIEDDEKLEGSLEDSEIVEEELD